MGYSSLPEDINDAKVKTTNTHASLVIKECHTLPRTTPDKGTTLQMTVVSSTSFGDTASSTKNPKNEISDSSEAWLTTRDLDSITNSEIPVIDNINPIIYSPRNSTRLSLLQSFPLSTGSTNISEQRSQAIFPDLELIPFCEQPGTGSDLGKFQSLFLSSGRLSHSLSTYNQDKTDTSFKDNLLRLVDGDIDNHDGNNSPAEGTSNDVSATDEMKKRPALRRLTFLNNGFSFTTLKCSRGGDPLKKSLDVESYQNVSDTSGIHAAMSTSGYTPKSSLARSNKQSMVDYERIDQNKAPNFAELNAPTVLCPSISLDSNYHSEISNAKNRLIYRKKISLRTLNYVFKTFGIKKLSPKIINTTRSFTDKTNSKKNWWGKIWSAMGNDDEDKNGLNVLRGYPPTSDDTQPRLPIDHSMSDVGDSIAPYPITVYTLDRVPTMLYSRNEPRSRSDNESPFASKLMTTLNLNLTMRKNVTRTFLRYKRGAGKSKKTDITDDIQNTTFSRSVFDTAHLPSSGGGDDTPRLVPIAVFECVKYLVSNGLRSNGLFRVNGSGARISELIARFEQSPSYGFGESFDGYSVYDVADCLKRYLRCMPACLFTRELSPAFIRCLKIPEHRNLRRMAVQLLFLLLPISHFQLLEHILGLFDKIVENMEYNRMNSRSLARIFGPSFLHLKNTGNSVDNYKKCSDILEYIIDNRDYFQFCSPYYYTYGLTSAVSKEVKEILENDDEAAKLKNNTSKSAIVYLTSKRFYKKKHPSIKIDTLHVTSVDQKYHKCRDPGSPQSASSVENSVRSCETVIPLQDGKPGEPPLRIDSDPSGRSHHRTNYTIRGLSANGPYCCKIAEDDAPQQTGAMVDKFRLFRRVNTNPEHYRYRNACKFPLIYGRAPAVF